MTTEFEALNAVQEADRAYTEWLIWANAARRTGDPDDRAEALRAFERYQAAKERAARLTGGARDVAGREEHIMDPITGGTISDKDIGLVVRGMTDDQMVAVMVDSVLSRADTFTVRDQTTGADISEAFFSAYMAEFKARNLLAKVAAALVIAVTPDLERLVEQL